MLAVHSRTKGSYRFYKYDLMFDRSSILPTVREQNRLPANVTSLLVGEGQGGRTSIRTCWTEQPKLTLLAPPPNLPHQRGGANVPLSPEVYLRLEQVLELLGGIGFQRVASFGSPHRDPVANLPTLPGA